MNLCNDPFLVFVVVETAVIEIVIDYMHMMFGSDCDTCIDFSRFVSAYSRMIVAMLMLAVRVIIMRTIILMIEKWDEPSEQFLYHLHDLPLLVTPCHSVIPFQSLSLHVTSCQSLSLPVMIIGDN